LIFSQRKGIKPAEKIAQIDSMDNALRNSLWSILTACYWDRFDRDKHGMGDRNDYIRKSNLGPFFISLYLDYFKDPIDTIPTYFNECYGTAGGLDIVRSYFFNADWNEVYDFIEFIADNGPEEYKDEFASICNKFLEIENSAYRFVNGVIIEITSNAEIAEVEEAILSSDKYYGVRQHLENAIRLLKDKESPDFRNSIKESISAVESICRAVSGDPNATLGAALKILEKSGTLHPALKSAFSSLYGYTNDANGIRHSLMQESDLNSADARFMLVSCSAFVNYVISTQPRDA
jgi:hypothetical protein